MFLKFIGDDGQELIVETNSYQVSGKSPGGAFILANVVRSDVGNGGENPTEFRLNRDEGWHTMYAMNNRGETIERVFIQPKTVREQPE